MGRPEFVSQQVQGADQRLHRPTILYLLLYGDLYVGCKMLWMCFFFFDEQDSNNWKGNGLVMIRHWWSHLEARYSTGFWATIFKSGYSNDWYMIVYLENAALYHILIRCKLKCNETLKDLVLFSTWWALQLTLLWVAALKRMHSHSNSPVVWQTRTIRILKIWILASSLETISFP